MIYDPNANANANALLPVEQAYDPYVQLEAIDGLVFEMLNELHANVPEIERPQSISDLSDDQLQRARRAVAVVTSSFARHRIEEGKRLAAPSDDVVEQFALEGELYT